MQNNSGMVGVWDMNDAQISQAHILATVPTWSVRS